MKLSAHFRRSGSLVAVLLATSLLSCGREITGPGGARWSGSVAFAPHFKAIDLFPGADVDNVAALVPFTKVRVIIQRNGATVVSRVVDFAATADSVALNLKVDLNSNDGDTLQALLRYINAAGDTVFSGGPITITVFPGSASNATAVEMPVVHVGPGSSAVSITVAPDSIFAVTGHVASLAAVARDGQNAVVNDAVFGFISRDPTKVVVPNIAVGSAQLVGARGSTYVIAQLVNGAADSTKITIDPRPSALTIVSGNNQSTLQSSAFAQPLRVRVTAIDGLGVAGWPVNFAITSGQGTLDSAVVHTDTAGFAEVHWTAGDSLGTATVTASIPAPALNVVFTGTQQSTAPTSMTFATQPTNITAGDTLPSLTVQVRNGAGTVMTGFNGVVALTLTGGTAGASIVGSTSVEASAGVATFSGLTVNRGGASYRVVAELAGVPDALSNTFDVAAAPAAQRTLFAGGGQSGPASTPLADSIVVRVTDQFGFPVPGVNVNFSVTQGGGGVSPVAGVTNADGRAATQWTLGTEGAQQISVQPGALTPLLVNATVVGGGTAVLFAGNDYTYVPAGQARTAPLFLSSPSASPITVTLATQFDSIVTFDVDSVTFAPGVTRIDVPLTAGTPGESWAYFTSSAGNDSLFVYVDSAIVTFAELNSTSFTLGDTVRTFVMLSDPAPTGGVTVKVKSLSPALVLLAASDGEGAPLPACLAPSYCGGGDLRAEQPVAAPAGSGALLGPLDDSTDVFIPAGHRLGYFVALVVGLGVDGSEAVAFEASAPGFVGDGYSISVDTLIVSAQSADATLSTPFGVGQVHRIYLYHPNGARVREHRFTISSANPAIASVDTSAVIERGEYFTPEISVHGQSVGSTYIRYGLAPGAVTDSFEVFVDSPRVLGDPNGVTFGVNESVYLYVSTSGPDGFPLFARGTALNISARSTDTSVVQMVTANGVIDAGAVTGYLLFRFVAAGSAMVIVEADGHTPDTLSLSTFAQPLTYHSGPQQVGVGQYDAVRVRIPDGLYSFTETQTLTITTLNPSIVEVITPTIHLGPETSIPSAVFAGVSPGVASIRFSVPGHPNLDLPITVLPTELFLSTSAQTIDPDSVEYDIAAYVSDGVFTHNMMDTVFAILRSSDESVVQVTDSIVKIAAGSDFGFGKYRGLQAGSAVLTIEADGIDPGVGMTITVQPFHLTISAAATDIGLGTREFAAFSRSSPSSAILDYTITQSGPGAVSFVTLPDSFPVGASALNFSIVGVTPGEDTITFSAAGHLPTTLIVTVDSVRLSLGDIQSEVVGGFRDEFVYGYLRVGESSLPRRADAQMKFVVTSLDTALAKVEQDTVVFSPGDVYPTQFASVRYRDFGTVDLVVTDPLGVIAPDTLNVSIGPRELFGYTSYGDGQLVLGMGQKTNDYEVAVGRGYFAVEPMWVQLKASAEGVISIPDSVLIDSWAWEADIRVVALDTVGSVRVEASVPGYNPWQFDVTVTRTVAEPWFDETYVSGQGLAEVYLIDALTGYARPMATPVPLRFTTTTPSSIDASIGTFNSDTSNYYTAVAGPIGLSVGRASATVEDARAPAFSQIASGSNEIDVRPPTIELLRDVYLVGLGLTSVAPSLSFNASAARDSIWVRFTTATARAKAEPDSLLLLRDLFEVELNAPSFTTNSTFTLTGDSLGVDTITVSADAFQSDFSVIRVEPGMLVLENEPVLTVVVGDSTFVTLALRDPGGGLAMAADVLQLSFSTDTNFVVGDGVAEVSSLNIPVSATSVSFWVKAINTGSSELQVTSPNFRPFRLLFTTRPIPE